MSKPGYTGVSLPNETTELLDQVITGVKEETGIDLNYPGVIKYMAKILLDSRQAKKAEGE